MTGEAPRRNIPLAALRRPEVGVVAGMAVQAICATIFAILTARWLGPYDRGLVVIFLTSSSFLMLAGSLGVGTGGRVLLNSTPGLDLARYLHYSRMLASFHAITSATLGVGLLVISGTPLDIWIGSLFVVVAVGQLISYLQREALHAFGYHISAVSGEVLSSVVQIGTVTVLFFTQQLNATMTCVAMAVGASVQAAYLAARLRLARSVLSKSGINLSLRRTIRFSIHAMATSLGQAFVIRGDRLILGVLASLSAVGIYGVAATFSEGALLISGGVAQVVFRKSSTSTSVDTTTRSRRSGLLITALLCVILASTSHWIIPGVLGESYRPAIGVTYVLLGAVIALSSYQLDAAVLNGLGKLKEASYITTVGSVVLVALCVLLVPIWNAYGAAWASVVAYLTMGALANRAVGRVSRLSVATPTKDANK